MAQKKFRYYPDVDALTPEGLEALVDNCIPIVENMHAELHAVAPHFAICLNGHTGSHRFIVIALQNQEALKVLPGILSDFGKKLGLLRMTNGIKEVDAFITIADTTYDTKERVMVVARNVHKKYAVRALEKKTSMNFLDGEALSTSVTLSVDTAQGEEKDKKEQMAEIFYDAYDYGASPPKEVTKRFEKIMKVMGTSKEYNDLKKAKGPIHDQVIISLIEQALSRIPEEAKKGLLITLAE